MFPRPHVTGTPCSWIGTTFSDGGWLARALQAAATNVWLLGKQLQARMMVQGVSHVDFILSCVACQTLEYKHAV